MIEKIKTISGHQFLYNDLTIKENKPYEVMLINTKKKFKSDIKYAINRGITKIEIDININKDDLLLLETIPLKALSLKGNNSKLDFSMLNSFSNIEYLSIAFSAKGKLDLLSFPNLEFLNIQEGIELINLDKVRSLKIGCFHNFKKCEIPSFGDIDIKEIYIYNSFIETLDILKNCASVKKITIEKSPKLKSLNGLETSAKSSKELAIRNCKLLSDYSILSKLSNLKFLYLLNCGTISDANIFSNMSKLKYGNIDINIEDGNVEPLLNSPIIFKNYKHFNHKNVHKIKIVMNDGNYLTRGKNILYKI